THDLRIVKKGGRAEQQRDQGGQHEQHVKVLPAIQFFDHHFGEREHSVHRLTALSRQDVGGLFGRSQGSQSGGGRLPHRFQLPRQQPISANPETTAPV